MRQSSAIQHAVLLLTRQRSCFVQYLFVFLRRWVKAYLSVSKCCALLAALVALSEGSCIKSALLCRCMVKIQCSRQLSQGAEPQYRAVIDYSPHTLLHVCNKHKVLSASFPQKQCTQQALAYAHLKKAEKLSKDLLPMKDTLIIFFVHYTLRQQSATSFSYQSIQVCKWPGTLTGTAILGQHEDEAFWGRFLKCRHLPR